MWSEEEQEKILLITNDLIIFEAPYLHNGAR